MEKKKLSGAAIFMYSMIAATIIISAASFIVYYCNICKNDVILWIGIVMFMVLYHFGLRILFGEITKKLNIDYNHRWFKERTFERELYNALAVKKWKNKVITFDPPAFDIKTRTLEQIATTMAKSELDHWINEIISLTSILFFFLWGCLPAFLISAIFAMIFDAQFIVIQRYNRPIVLRLNERKKALKAIQVG